MNKKRMSDIARNVAQVVALIETLPAPPEERDRVVFGRLKDLLREVDRDLAQADEMGVEWDAKWVDRVTALGIIVLDWVLKRNGQ